MTASRPRSTRALHPGDDDLGESLRPRGWPRQREPASKLRRAIRVLGKVFRGEGDEAGTAEAQRTPLDRDLLGKRRPTAPGALVLGGRGCHILKLLPEC